MTGPENAFARDVALREASEALACAQAAFSRAARAIEGVAVAGDMLIQVAQVARTQAHLADALTSVIYTPADERTELLLAMLAAGQGSTPSGRH